MIISLNWLKKYVQWDVSTEELVGLIGSRLVEVEGVIDERGRYDGIYIVRVVTCEKVPETHLSLCRVDDGGASKVARGEDGLVQVVCGAGNVRAGMLAAWIAPGATVPASFHEDAPFVLGVRKMRGYESYGMLAGADELGFSDDHSGIAEFEPALKIKPGDKLAEVFGLDDVLLDIENKSLTHRPDCFGVVGFAREVAGILGKPFVEPEFIATPGAAHIVGQEKVDLKIKITDAGLCPRYEALVMSRKDRSGAGYLTEVQTLICRAGMRSVDPIVDMTNYLMLLTGQPLHAFDYDKLVAVGGGKGAEIVVRAAKMGEKMVLLDGREIEMSTDDIVICSGEVPVALAGAMGGLSTAIDRDTRRVIVESATFSLYNLRKAQMRHGIFSEAITRFTKGVPAGMTEPVVREFAREMAGGLTPLALFDEYPEPVKPVAIEVSVGRVNALLGTGYTEQMIAETLRNVGFAVESKTAKQASEDNRFADFATTLVVTPPFWRTDVDIAEDVIEEVGRLLGYDNIALVLPEVTADGARIDPLLVLKSEIRDVLAAGGANEALTYSFVHGNLIEKGRQKPEVSYKIVNSISPALEYVRQSLIPSLLDIANTNLRDNFERFTLFEMNPVTNKRYGLDDEKVPIEKQKLALAHVDIAAKTPYYALKKQLEFLLNTLGITPKFSPIKIDDGSPASVLSASRSAEVSDAKTKTSLGIIGEILPRVAADFKLPSVAVAQIHLDDLLALCETKKLPPVAVLPTTDRDVSLVVASNTEYVMVQDAVEEVLRKAGLVFRITPIAIYQGEDKSKKTVTLHLEFASSDKTLTKEENAAIMGRIEKVEVK